MIFNREFYIQKLIQKQGNGLIKIVTGLRRAGKSFLLFDLFNVKRDNKITSDTYNFLT